MSGTDLRDLVAVDVADVYKGGDLAGKLRRTSHSIVFEYNDDHLARRGPAIATSIPLTDEPFTASGSAVPAFFAGLLPEGRRLSSLRRAVKTSADDEFSLLLAVGRDVIGDVQVVPEGDDFLDADSAVVVENSWEEVSFDGLLSEAGIVDRVGIPGVQDKASARVVSVPLSKAGKRFILKVDPPEYPHLVANEAYFLALAHRLRIECTDFEVVHDCLGRAGLLIQRFDRKPQPDGTSRPLACEDACQVLGRWPADKYRVITEELVRSLADRCPARLVATRRLYELICFAWLTGNGDLHAKNVSILSTGQGEWRIAPAYDFPSTVPYGDRTFALPIGGKTSGFSRRRLLDLAEKVGLPRTAAVRLLDRLLVGLAAVDDDLLSGALPFSSTITRDWVDELRFRRRQLMG